VVEPQPTALAAVLGEQVGGIFAALHTAHDVTFRFGTGVTGFAGEGSVSAVELDGGESLPADLVLVGVGVLPNTELAESAGLAVAASSEGGGVLVDSALRTSDPDVYAAGDIARWEHPLLGYRVRVEHWANARESGITAAKAMLGQEVSYDVIPYFFTDQYDAGMEYAGDVPRGTAYEVVLRGDPASGEYMAFWLDGDDRMLAGMHVNMWDTIDAVQDLIRAKAPLDRARLADPKVDLADTRA
jgi:3-phenylpropionate/trans-cinnamate dioxygenase ferredoxin reductase subunit